MRVFILGGMLKHQFSLARALSKTEEVVVAGPLDDLPDSIARTAEGSFELRPFKRRSHTFHPAVFLFLFRTWLRLWKFKPDVVNLDIGGSLLDYPFLLGARGYPVVATFHDVFPHTGEESSDFEIVRSAVRRRADQIIVHGDKLREQMIHNYGLSPQKVHSVPLGAPELKAFLAHEKPNVPSDEKMVLFFGRLHAYKGLEYLIAAEPLITKEVPGAKVVIAGAGEDFSRYRKMMQGREDNFIVLNRHTTFEEGAELFQRCSVVALPYIGASQSGVVPIAYGFKKPVVVTDTGSLSEVVKSGETGFVVPPRDTEALAKAVITLLKDRNLRKIMGENGFKSLERIASWEDIAAKTLIVYREAIRSRSQKGLWATLSPWKRNE